MQIELDLYSGRPNPSWSLTADEERTLAERLATLLPAVAAATPEPLGYRGLRFVDPNDSGPIEVGAGVVVTTDRSGRIERRADPHRALECWLLDTARGRLDEPLRQIALAGSGPACE